MFGNALQGWHIIVIILVILLLFGAPKLPKLARSIGQSMRIFKAEVRTLKDLDDETLPETLPKGDEVVSETPSARP